MHESILDTFLDKEVLTVGHHEISRSINNSGTGWPELSERKIPVY